MGVCKLYKNIFKTDKVVIVCKSFNSAAYIKTYLTDTQQFMKKGTESILTKGEKNILHNAKELLLKNRLIYPLVFSDVMGAVYIKRKSSKPFDDMEQRWFISLSENLSTSLKIFTLYQEQRKVLLASIKSLSRFLDQYVPTSYIHARKVSRLIRDLGKELKLTKREVKSLEYAAKLHDAGKLEIPTNLLKKKRRLTKKEYELIMEHPRRGVELVKDLQILKPALPTILYHHERWDGKGYPSRLKKEQIPLGARILAVIDAFDAMFFGRPYKEKQTIADIIKELKKYRGSQFDPRVVDALMRILKRKKTAHYLHATP